MAALTPADLDRAKHAARMVALIARAGCEPAWGEHLAAHVLADCPPPPGAAVSGFWPLPGEIDLAPLLRALHARGHCVLLPVTPRRGHALRFRAWHPGMALMEERFGTRCPPPEAAEGVPDILFVPLLAFDRAGHRLGYGGGFYDRTLAGLPGARAIGCAFAAQELDAVPAGEYDAPLHAVATERGVRRFERG